MLDYKKILFLDIDGVLNSDQFDSAFFRDINNSIFTKNVRFCPLAIENLLMILQDVRDVEVVISSDWRITFSLDDLKTFFQDAGLPSSRFIDVTPRIVEHIFRRTPRGKEIQKYLDEHPEVGKFVILDDKNDMLHLNKHLVRTDSKMGLMYDKAIKVIKRFKREE